MKSPKGSPSGGTEQSNKQVEGMVRALKSSIKEKIGEPQDGGVLMQWCLLTSRRNNSDTNESGGWKGSGGRCTRVRKRAVQTGQGRKEQAAEEPL